jgi:colanic acid/amylovoran biosynthesis glycosyltransferase
MKQDKIIAIHSFPVWLPQTQTWMYNQVKYLPQSVEVHVVCERTQHLEQFVVPNIHSLRDVSRLRYYWEKGLRKLRIQHDRGFLTSMAQETNAHIVHSHFGHIGWANLSMVRRANAKHVVTFYGADVTMLPAQDKGWLSRYRELFDGADLFLCEGPYMAKKLIELGCPEEKIKVHHLGVEIQAIPYRPRHWQDTEPLRVLIAAGFREKKGIPYALESLARLQRMVSVEITLIGDADSKLRSRKEKQHILEIINASGLKPRIRLLGYQPYTTFFEEAYKHHVFISPSVTASDGDTEGGAPVALIEMIATGMPVVSTLHCDIPEVVQYGVENWLVDERDVAGLVNRLRWLIENANTWDQFLDVGRRHVEIEFNALVQGKSLAKIYRDALGN